MLRRAANADSARPNSRRFMCFTSAFPSGLHGSCVLLHVMSYNLTVERSFCGQWVADAAYIGNSGRQIPGQYNLNAGMVLGAGASGQPEYQTFDRTAETMLIYKGTNSNYNSVQARITHHESGGLIWTSAYAYQKAMGYVSSAGSPSAFNFYADFQRNFSPLTYTSTLHSAHLGCDFPAISAPPSGICASSFASEVGRW